MPDAVRAFVGNFKGPKGEQGPQGIQGPAGPQGIQGPAGPSNADGIYTVDTSGVLVSAGESTDLQRLIDAIADKVMTKLLAKTDIVQVESTATNTVPSSAYLKSVKDDINSNLVNFENSTVVVDYATAINITTLKTWTESSYAISSPPAGFTFSDIVSITAFAQDGYGDRWLRVIANQRANASGTLSLMGYCINTTGSIPIIIRVIFKK